MRTLRKILLPFSWLYGLVILLRNKCYDWGWFSTTSYEIPLICIGNLRVGGTGKTPMTEFITRILCKEHRLALLSRGYKRQSEGFVMADENTTVQELGDEPFQFFRKFPEVVVAVDANRREGIRLLQEKAAPEVILLDDAFQHRKVKAGLNILLTVYGDLYTDDVVLPAGNLRDTRNQASRAQVIVVTKCPAHLSVAEMKDVTQQLDPLPGQEVFFATIDYDSFLYNAAGASMPLSDLPPGAPLITGIASPGPLLHHLNSLGLSFTHQAYSDHHNFAPHEVKKLSKHAFLFTTEKDFMRLEGQLDNLWYLPIRTRLLSREEEFRELLKNYVSGYEA
ncbi:tetraacyldisaccharide 4'-kinase [Robertkochia flava]|uniref:tetraacyldisaccharide 4'-kinase n=1 Tax=Robertkochia flava TaxID=3447986 RepID=UPI001CCEAC64|nr:tetraacyldisaccharide 4'-kinase [Robertkochia marina]